MTEKPWTYKGDYPLSQATRVDLGNHIFVNICPDCKDHKRGDADKVHDCKNIFYEVIDGKKVTHSQCMCYSASHGKRD